MSGALSWVVWAVLLASQTGSQTFVSRARNSRSLGYHTIASVCSNGVWFFNLGFAIDKVSEAFHSGSKLRLLTVAGFYIATSVVGSVSSHHFLMTRVERGSRRIG